MIKVDDSAEGIIFDLDGTLIDSMPVHKIAWQEVCSLKNFDFTDEIFYRYAGVPSDKIFAILNDRYGTDFDPPYHSRMKEEAYRKIMDRVKVIPEVLEVVRHYYKKIPLAVGTGGPKDHSLEILKMKGLDQYFDAVVTKDDVENGKPAPDTFLKCAELMKVPPKHCVVFEDGDPGIAAAEKAGMMVVDVRQEIA